MQLYTENQGCTEVNFDRSRAESNAWLKAEYNCVFFPHVPPYFAIFPPLHKLK